MRILPIHFLFHLSPCEITKRGLFILCTDNIFKDLTLFGWLFGLVMFVSLVITCVPTICVLLSTCKQSKPSLEQYFKV